MVRDALLAIADAGPGVLVHCSAGRDRTGMISALLLANAGVAPEVIAEDHAASVRAMAGAASGAPTHDRQSGWDEDQVREWLAATTPLVLDAVGDVPAVLDALGVDEHTRTRLRRLLTEP